MAENSPAISHGSHLEGLSTGLAGAGGASREIAPAVRKRRGLFRLLAIVALLLAAGFAIFPVVAFIAHTQTFTIHTGTPVIMEIGILVFREGLECMLVLAAITAGMTGGRESHRRPIALGAGVGFIATLATWAFAVRVIDDLSVSISALALQAATGLLAVVVLLVVMNWFFHKVYWTGWISMHNQRKRDLLEGATLQRRSKLGLFWGMALLGFTSFYREGFEVVLFLQTYRLRHGGATVFGGVCLGLVLTGIMVALTFAAHRRLPYRKMLILTGALLGLVLLVMVGEQAQEMQLAHWISTTHLPSLEGVIPAWMGVWLSVFPTVETLLAQAVAAILVLGSYFVAGRGVAVRRRKAVAGEPHGQGLTLESQKLDSRNALIG